ncbi:MAG TPA: ABC transporter permease [Arthrobacter bacterium]|jgi:multiple sugar transport system permease protein|nr:ABC transporter permease [Arthrobacter sp.]HAP89780.1 ABC transporter permease [Arthrobacter sp.]HBH59862.1 ABC transporter permease [Arthrobacter sp.]HCB58645.1 ABC transporter permease [Arthrobacter sp.]HCC39747.1 ABC transporter permease [Arthrobacter sp.]
MIETRNFRILRNVVLTILSLWVAIPLYVVVSTSLKPLKDVAGLFQWIPREITASPYLDIWTTVPLAKYFQNSLIITVCATVCSVTVAVLAAYAIARLQFKGKRAFSLTVLSTQMFPGILFLLPLYLIFTQIRNLTGLQLQGSYLGLIITYMTFTLPFAIWMLSGYFASIPKELEEASMIDGTGRMGALFRVILPVAKPGIIAVAVYSFISAWGEVLFASVLTNEATKTLSLGLKSYASESDVFWNQLMAASVVVSLPVLIGFILVQKHLVAGLSAGAVK